MFKKQWPTLCITVEVRRNFKAKINAYACTFNAIQSYLILTVFAGTSPNITNESQIPAFPP